MNWLVEVAEATVRVGITRLLEASSISVGAGEIWAFLGGNGSGKTVFSELVSGLRQPASGEVTFARGITPDGIQVLSFEEQSRVIERERKNDESWLLDGATDVGTTVRDFVAGAPGNQRAAEPAAGDEATLLLDRFRLSHRADGGLRFLSTGEIRKAILCRALIRRPRLLVLDDPFAGLDLESADDLRSLIPTLAASDHAVILVLGRESHLSEAVTHIAYLADRRVVYAGTRDGYRRWRSQEETSADRDRESATRIPGVAGRAVDPASDGQPIVRLDQVSVSYGPKPILDRITWQARAGESWHITGPNGAGKTTLLSLISGGSTKAYGQDIWLFGQKRGSGESIWEIKSRIGLVSGDFHNAYPLRTRTLDAILSGFSDSAGLYDKPSGYQIEIARVWLQIIGLKGREELQLRKLSYGEQRAVLVARAMVKRPPLLIADEPCQGLDDRHSSLVMSVLEQIGRDTETCILYVSHDPTLTLRTATHRLALNPSDTGSTAVIESLSSPA